MTKWIFLSVYLVDTKQIGYFTICITAKQNTIPIRIELRAFENYIRKSSVPTEFNRIIWILIVF